MTGADWHVFSVSVIVVVSVVVKVTLGHSLDLSVGLVLFGYVVSTSGGAVAGAVDEAAPTSVAEVHMVVVRLTSDTMVVVFFDWCRVLVDCWRLVTEVFPVSRVDAVLGGPDNVWLSVDDPYWRLTGGEYRANPIL